MSNSLWPHGLQAPWSITNSESGMPSNHLILCHALLLLPSIFPSIRGFSNKLAICIRWPKYWSFSFSTSRFNEYSGLISFRINWFDLLAVQGTLKSPLYRRSTARRSNQSILKEINPEYSLGRLVLKLKLHYFGQLIWRTNSLKRPRCWERLRPRWEGGDRG